jgi:hypothetical protein
MLNVAVNGKTLIILQTRFVHIHRNCLTKTGSFLRNLKLHSNTRISQHFMEPEGSSADPSGQANVSQPPGIGPVLGPGINYTGPRKALLEFVIFIF